MKHVINFSIWHSNSFTRFRSRPHLSLLVTQGLLIVATACLQEPEADAIGTVRDSAGIEIVQTVSGGLWAPDEAWRISDRPVVEIGSAPGDELYRVRDAVRLSDGRLVVANGGTGELLFFSSEGRFRVAAGGLGGGTGEFRTLAALDKTEGDSLLTYDTQTGLISLFDPVGTFVRSIQIEVPVGLYAPLVRPAGWLETGAFVAQVQRVEEPIQETHSERQGRLSYRATAALLFFGPEGDLQQSVEGFLGNESVTSITSLASGRFSLRSQPAPFLKKFETSAVGRVVAAGVTDVYEFHLYGEDGKVERIIRGPWKPRLIRNADIEAWVNAQLSGIEDPGMRSRRRREYETLPFPKYMPAFEALLVDVGGRLWVREYEPLGAADSEYAKWSVYARRGRRLGEVRMPRGYRPFEIGDDIVLGLWTDSLDVEHVRLYRLIKPAWGAK